MAISKPDYDAVVIGAGFSGIRSLWELTQNGLTAKCFEAGSDVGGAWYWNRYPGARTDSEAWAYALNFAPEVVNQWKYSERYPSQQEVQGYIRRIAAHYDLLRHIQFDTLVISAHFNEKENLWTITDKIGKATTCRYFIPATGPLSIAKKPPFSGLDSYKGEVYQASSWPKQNVDIRGKRVAVIGTGATGVQIIPKIARVAKQVTVFQRTPNYVLPGRNYFIDDHEADEIKQKYGDTLKKASVHPFGLAMDFTGKTADKVTDAKDIRQTLDSGWETGGFHYMFETFDDLFTSAESNENASEYIRQKIRAIVRDPETAELLCPHYPFLSKRPPCGHFYYEAYNRPNVRLVDVSKRQIEMYEKGIRLADGEEHEVDMIICALGYDAGVGALSEIDVRGLNNQSLGELWARKLQTFAGVLVPEFPNMFMVCGPHIPFGNMPVILDAQMDWIGKTIRHMEENKLGRIEVPEPTADSWGDHVEEAFQATLFSQSAKDVGAWFVGGNSPLFYFGGVANWVSWLDKEMEASWSKMQFTQPKGKVLNHF